MYFVLILFGYLLGSIPTGYWITKAIRGIDIRQYGSKSTGATNVLRCAGKGWAAVVLAIDVAKGYFPVLLSFHLESTNSNSLVTHWQLLPPLVAAACILGHSKSVFLQFQGGKSAATGLGTLLALKPLVALSSLMLWVLVVVITKYVSLASIVTSVFACAAMIIGHAPISYLVLIFLAATYVIYRHQANIMRLLSGHEPKLGQNNSINDNS